MKIRLPVVFLVLVGFSSCFLIRFANGVNQDAYNFDTKRKEYVYKLTFRSVVLNKSVKLGNRNDFDSICFLSLRLVKIDPFPNFYDKAYYSNYEFKGDSILSIRIKPFLANQISVGDSVLKDPNNFDLEIKNGLGIRKFPWVNETYGKSWLK